MNSGRLFQASLFAEDFLRGSIVGMSDWHNFDGRRHLLDLIQRRRHPRRQACRQQAEGGVALGTMVAGDPASVRVLRSEVP